MAEVEAGSGRSGGWCVKLPDVNSLSTTVTTLGYDNLVVILEGRTNMFKGLRRPVKVW